MEKLTINDVPEELAAQVRQLARIHAGGDVSVFLLLLVAERIDQPLYFLLCDEQRKTHPVAA